MINLDEACPYLISSPQPLAKFSSKNAKSKIMLSEERKSKKPLPNIITFLLYLLYVFWKIIGKRLDDFFAPTLGKTYFKNLKIKNYAVAQSQWKLTIFFELLTNYKKMKNTFLWFYEKKYKQINFLRKTDIYNNK